MLSWRNTWFECLSFCRLLVTSDLGRDRGHSLVGLRAVNVSVIIATYGDETWRDLAMSRAYPSALNQGAHEIVVGHDDEGTIASVRNALAEKAEGTHLLFLDADDELAPGFIQAMFGAMRQDAARRGEDGSGWVCSGEVLYTPAVQQMRKGRR